MENKFDKYLGSLKVPFKKSKDEAWSELYSKTIEVDTPKVIQFNDPFFKRRSFWVGAAASLALILSVAYLFNLNTPTELSSKSGEMKQIELPDGSTAILNAGSSLMFDRDNWSNERLVTLEGEAFFHVKKGNSFIVNTPNGNVKVLGTSFNVFSRGSDFSVSCKTGKVEVSNTANAVLLTPGLCTYSSNNGLVEPHPFETELIGIWKQREYYHFENVPLQHVFNELERQFSVSFELNGVPEDIVVNADINIQELDKALKVVCATYGLSADKSNHSVYKIFKK